MYNCDITINSNDNFILESKMSNDEIKAKIAAAMATVLATTGVINADDGKSKTPDNVRNSNTETQYDATRVKAGHIEQKLLNEANPKVTERKGLVMSGRPVSTEEYKTPHAAITYRTFNDTGEKETEFFSVGCKLTIKENGTYIGQEGEPLTSEEASKRLDNFEKQAFPTINILDHARNMQER